MGSLLAYGSLVSAMSVIVLIEIEAGEEEPSPNCEAQSENEELVSPAVVEDLSDKSPSSFYQRLRIPFGDHLSGAA